MAPPVFQVSLFDLRPLYNIGINLTGNLLLTDLA